MPGPLGAPSGALSKWEQINIYSRNLHFLNRQSNSVKVQHINFHHITDKQTDPDRQKELPKYMEMQWTSVYSSCIHNLKKLTY